MGLIRNRSFLLFTLVCGLLVGGSKILASMNIGLPNLSLVLPVLVVMTAFPVFKSRFSNLLKFGVIGVVMAIDIGMWGWSNIYLFTWSMFLVVFLVSRYYRSLSFTDTYREVTLESLKTTAGLILLYDVVTAFGTFLLFPGGLVNTYVMQIPFTFYHLSSLIFIPGLVLVGKVITRIKVKDKQVVGLSLEDLTPVKVPFTADK